MLLMQISCKLWYLYWQIIYTISLYLFAQNVLFSGHKHLCNKIQFYSSCAQAMHRKVVPQFTSTHTYKISILIVKLFQMIQLFKILLFIFFFYCDLNKCYYLIMSLSTFLYGFREIFIQYNSKTTSHMYISI